MLADYENSILAWRREKEESLRAEEGWLSLSGLYWLSQGEHTAGTSPECAILLPWGAAPALAGSFLVRGDEVTFRAAPGVTATRGGVPLGSGRMAPDAGPPTRVVVGNVSMALIRRGDRLAIRVWDRSAPARRTFPGRRWFDVDARFRVDGRFESRGDARPLLVPDVTGGVQRMMSPGDLVFELSGQSLRLTALQEDDDSLFLIFADATTGESTYPSGRYLYTAMPVSGRVEIDFNRAYNPPCAFTPHATCPLPPSENRLPVRIEAGERYKRQGPL